MVTLVGFCVHVEWIKGRKSRGWIIFCKAINVMSAGVGNGLRQDGLSVQQFHTLWPQPIRLSMGQS